jgi:hypothetical protein
LGPTNSSWGSGSRAQVTFFFGGGASGDETAVASQAYANAGALAQQMVGLATAHDFIDGYLLDYEAFCADCPAGRHPNVTECLRARASCVPREAASLAKLFKTLSSALHAKGKRLGFATNKNGAGFEHWPYYQSYLNAGVDRLYEMGTYCNHTRKGGPSDRENVTRQLLNYPLESTAFGLGDYRHFDSAAEAGAWLSELRAGALDRASPNFMGLASLGLDIEGFCDFLCSALLLKAILGLDFLGLALSSSRLRARSATMPGQLTCHVYDLFGADPASPGPAQPCVGEFDHHCPRPPEPWWPVLERFHGV